MADPVQWKIIVIALGVRHESKPIIEGTKLIFKTEFIVPLEIFDIYKNDIQIDNFVSDPDIVDNTEINLYKTLLTNIDETISKLEIKRQEVIKFLSVQNFDYTNLIENIKSSSKVAVVILDRYYVNPHLKNLIPGDQQLYYHICAAFPSAIVKLREYAINHSVGDELDNENSVHNAYSKPKYLDLRANNGIRENEYDIFYQNPNNNEIPGNFIGSSLKYNDQGYDTVYKYKVIGIFIIKK